MKNFDATRKKLKLSGWKREDRTSNGVSKELWIPPWNGLGMRPLGVSYEAACKIEFSDKTTEGNEMNIGMGVTVNKDDVEKQWTGKWYKPWSWPVFSDKYFVYVWNDFRFIECSVVKSPVEPSCKIRM